MLCLLIADDERHVADSLENMLRPLAREEEIDIRKAYSGREALAVVRARAVHVALLDINMPGMSGLALAEELVRAQPDAHLIFLTGYSEFDYAYRAARFRNESFLLKVEDDEVIVAAVKGAFEEVKREALARKRLSEAERGERITRFLWNGQLLKRALSGGGEAGSGRFPHGACWLLGGEILFEKQVEDFARVEALANLAHTLACALKPRFQAICAEWNDDFVACLWPEDAGAEDAASVRTAAEAALERAADEYGARANLALWPRPIGLGDAAAALFTMRPERERSPAQSPVRVAREARSDGFPEAPEMLLEKLRDALTREQPEPFLAALGQVAACFESVSDMRCLPAMEAFERVRLMLILRLGRLGVEAQSEWQDRLALLSPAVGFTSWKQAFLRLRELSEALFREIARLHRSGADETLARVLDYMRAHLSEPFTLREMADALNYNATYLSRFFRNATGERLFTYVGEQRIMLAKKLLRDSQLGVAQIAARCGFDNAQYFATLFKASEGATPSDWRKQFK